jgi:hypothetical protein
VALGAACGAVLSCANFWAMHKLLEAAFSMKGRRRVVVQALLMAKMAFLVALVFVAPMTVFSLQFAVARLL